MIAVPRESVELVAVEVLVDGEAVDDYEVAVTAPGGRPLVWNEPDTAGVITGILTGSYPVGSYEVWARYVSAPETPVVKAGRFTIT